MTVDEWGHGGLASRDRDVADWPELLCEAVGVAVIAVAELVGISGRRGELAAVLEQFEREAATEPGCRRYTFAVTLADADHILFVSEWDSQEALDAHYASASFANFQFGLNGLLARPSEMTVYAFSDSVRPVNTRPMDPRDAD